MHNCCKRDTEFITDNGVKSFEDFEDGDIVNVLTHTGEYKKAVVHSYGEQMLYKIKFVRSGQQFSTQYFTKNHRWFLKNGDTTTNLKKGDIILKAPNIYNFDYDTATEKEKYYWCLGFVLGDGSNNYRWSHGKKNENIRFVRLRLCGAKIQYAERFNILKHSKREIENGDLQLTFSSVINFVKELPKLHELTLREKMALFDGLYCADGQKSGHVKALFTQDEMIASFVEQYAPSFGKYITDTVIKDGETTNYGVRGFARNYKFIGDNNKYYWVVDEIEESHKEVVWCLDVEDNHSFILPNGIVTSNCLTIPFDDLLKNGFKTRQTDIRPANSINTAFQLVAVIFQLQSLQQFGGVAANCLDWTMVPYVRKSFAKHYRDGMKFILNKEWEVNDTMELIDEKYKVNQKAYKYAMELTERELNQSVEALYHNLVSLQSRSGNQLK